MSQIFSSGLMKRIWCRQLVNGSCSPLMEAGRVKFEGARDSSVIKRIAQIAEISVKGLSRIIIVWQKKARLGDWTCYKSGTSWRTFGLPRMCGCLLIALLRDVGQVEKPICREVLGFLQEYTDVRAATDRCCTGLQLPARLQQQ